MGQRKRIVIVGGVAGGASAAAKARRISEDAEIVLFERGGDISFANCGLPYHVGGIIPDRARLLVQSPQAMRLRFAIDVRTRSEVIRINRQAKTVVVQVDRLVQHRLYGKRLRQRRRYKAHDEQNACHVGDLVRIVETRPLSKEKRWRVVEIIQRGEELGTI